MKELEYTRLTIVDETGRAYEKWDITEMVFDVQDDGRTLKIFLTSEPESNHNEN